MGCQNSPFLKDSDKSPSVKEEWSQGTRDDNLAETASGDGRPYGTTMLEERRIDL